MEAEVERLTELKTSRLKEIVLKRRTELEDICKNAHIEPDLSTAPEQTNTLIDSGNILCILLKYNLHLWTVVTLLQIVTLLPMLHSGTIDPSELLANIESQILKAKEESLSRKDIMDRINKWIAACDEEAWLEEYNQVFSSIFSFKLKCSNSKHASSLLHNVPDSLQLKAPQNGWRHSINESLFQIITWLSKT
jgi:protein regulator of cytokinesis 1